MKKKINIKIISFSILAIILILSVVFTFFKFKTSSAIRDSLKDLNVILITIDTLRADYLSCYKKGNASTPNIDKIASEGVLFERCIAQTPITLPSHTTILSGTYPLYHKVRDNGGFIVPKKLEFLSEVLQANMVTSAFIAAYVLHSKWGINQGFNEFSDDFDLAKHRDSGLELEKRADTVLNDAKHWIIKNKSKRFFTWIHLFDPHAPYEPPEPFYKKNKNNLYAGEVEYIDFQLGKFFDFLKEQSLLEKSLIIITADHGEGLLEHNERTHAYFVYESTVHVPLIFRLPKKIKNIKVSKNPVSRLVELVDIAPTILDILSIPIPKSYQGTSLFPLMQGKKIKKPEIAYTESFYSRLHLNWSELQAIYLKNFKYIKAPREELYNLKEDKNELNSIIANNPKKIKLRKLLYRFIKEKSKNSITSIKQTIHSSEEKKRLESLGYLANTIKTTDKKNLPDPKDKIAFLERYEKTRAFMTKNNYKKVIENTEKLLIDEPDNVDTLILRGVAFIKNNQSIEAIKCFYDVLALKPDYNDAMINLINALIVNRDIDLAIKECKRFIESFPEDHTLYTLLGDAYFYKEDYSKSEKYLKHALSLENKNSNALNRLGEICIINKEYIRAKSYINKAIKIYSKTENAFFNLAQIREVKGEFEKAIELYKKELENYPLNFISAFLIAENSIKLSNEQEAVLYYKKTIKINKEYKIAYFKLAEYYLKKEINYNEAIDLCKSGIKIEPSDETTLFGYYILTNLYAKTKDMKNFNIYSKQGERLYKNLESKKRKQE